jgi:hypothetical protein
MMTQRSRVVRAVMMMAIICLTMPSRSYAADECDTLGIPNAMLKRLLNQQLASLLSPQSSAIVGNFAAIDIKEAEASFAGTTVFESGTLLGIKLRGGAAEGLLPIIQDQATNAKLGVDVQLNFFGPRRRDTLIYDVVSCEKYWSERHRIEREFAAKQMDIARRSSVSNREIARLLRSGKRTAIRKSIDSLIAKQKIDDSVTKQLAVLRAGKADTTTRADTMRLDHLRVDSLRNELAKAVAADSLLRLEAQTDTTDELDVALTWRTGEFAKLPAILEVRGFKLGWWSVGAGIGNVAFRLFEPSQPFNDQVTKRSYVSQSATIQYSSYFLSSKAYETRFSSWHLTAAITDNLAELTGVELTDTKPFGPNPNDRVSIKKYTAYQGTYARNIGSAILGHDRYWFLFNRNQGAIHFYPAVQVKAKTRAAYSAGLGYLITARSKADNPIVNAELYFNLTDITDVRETGHRRPGRSEFGARLTFPFLFTPKA